MVETRREFETKRGVFWGSLFTTLTVMTALIILLFPIPLSWFPVEGTFQFEYALRPRVSFWWNQTEPIDANSIAQLRVFDKPSCGIVEEDLASANVEYLRVVMLFGPMEVSLWAGNRSIEVLWVNNPLFGVPYLPNPSLFLADVVEILRAKGIKDENCMIIYDLWVGSVYAYVPGLQSTGLWGNSEHTLAEVYLLVQDGKITSISNSTYPLEKTVPIQLYNPIILNMRMWLPPILLASAVPLQMVILYKLHKRENVRSGTPSKG